jgi:hypothetical protein
MSPASKRSRRHLSLDIPCKRTDGEDSKKAPILSLTIRHNPAAKCYAASIVAGEKDPPFTTLFFNGTHRSWKVEPCNRFSPKRLAELFQQLTAQAKADRDPLGLAEVAEANGYEVIAD